MRDYELAKDSFKQISGAEARKNIGFDYEQLYMRSYQELAKIFYDEFPTSDQYKQMVLLMNENMIEYRFMQKAGILKNS